VSDEQETKLEPGAIRQVSDKWASRIALLLAVLGGCLVAASILIGIVEFVGDWETDMDDTFALYGWFLLAMALAVMLSLTMKEEDKVKEGWFRMGFATADLAHTDGEGEFQIVGYVEGVDGPSVLIKRKDR
jgi:hypothetical protein